MPSRVTFHAQIQLSLVAFININFRVTPSRTLPLPLRVFSSGGN
jgi:hypothetical protein